MILKVNKTPKEYISRHQTKVRSGSCDDDHIMKPYFFTITWFNSFISASLKLRLSVSFKVMKIVFLRPKWFHLTFVWHVNAIHIRKNVFLKHHRKRLSEYLWMDNLYKMRHNSSFWSQWLCMIMTSVRCNYSWCKTMIIILPFMLMTQHHSKMIFVYHKKCYFPWYCSFPQTIYKQLYSLCLNMYQNTSDFLQWLSYHPGKIHDHCYLVVCNSLLTNMFAPFLFHYNWKKWSFKI